MNVRQDVVIVSMAVVNELVCLQYVVKITSSDYAMIFVLVNGYSCKTSLVFGPVMLIM